MINLSNKIWCIFGLNASGKSNLSKKLAQSSNAVYFDVLNEHSKEFDSYVPTNKNYPAITQEIDILILKLQNSKYNTFIVDEASRIFPNMKPIMPNFRSYFDTFRHHKLNSVGFICRRPSQLATDIVELAHIMFIFKLTGTNDIDKCNRIVKGLGDVVSRLPKYHFVIVNEDRTYQVCNPI